MGTKAALVGICEYLGVNQWFICKADLKIEDVRGQQSGSLQDKECNGGCPNNHNLFHLSIPLSLMYLSASFRGKTQCGAKPRSEA